jgi:hypothetical protein
MGKRAVDLNLEELAALGAKAARLAVAQARQRGLTITGTVEFFDGEQSVSSLAELHPSGTVTLVEPGETNKSDDRPEERPFRRP